MRALKRNINRCLVLQLPFAKTINGPRDCKVGPVSLDIRLLSIRVNKKLLS